MFLPRDDRQQVARLFGFLLQGEQIAQACANRQAQLFEEKAEKKFLLNQSRQESFHCRVFRSGIGVLAPRGVSDIPGKKEILQYGSLLDEALARGDKAESLLAMQIILEGMGDVTVKRIDKGFGNRGLGRMCRKVRHLILGQEDAHHAFGVTRFNKLIQEDQIPDYLIKRSQDYLALLEQLMLSMSEVFDHFNIPIENYMDEFYADVPDWIAIQRS